MIIQCPVTGVVWGNASRSSLNFTLKAIHPYLHTPLSTIREHAQQWDTLREEDKQLLWSATLSNSALVTIRGGLRPSASLVESSFHSLLQLLTWASTQQDPASFLPSWIPESLACGNLRGWISALKAAKREWQTQRDSYALQLSEVEQTTRMDKKLAKYRAANKVGEETIPASLANWLLIASEAPEGVSKLWKSILCGTNQQVLLNRGVTLADLDELLEHLQTWEHSTLVRLLAIRQVTAKAQFHSANSLDGEASLDFLLGDSSTSATKPDTFTLEASPLSFSTFTTSAPLTDLDRAEVLKGKQAEMAAKAKERLAAILASQATKGASQ